jgi:hypothetical protein
MGRHKVECQCCKMMMVPKVVRSAPFYLSGIPLGGGKPESSVCPFCLSPKWMLTENAVIAGEVANWEFFLIMLLTLLNITVLVRFGIVFGVITMFGSAWAFHMRSRILRKILRR